LAGAVVILLVSGSLEASDVAKALKSRGHTVRRAGTGAGAIAASLEKGLDVAVVDFDLPDMPGIDVVRAVRAQSPGLPLIGIGGGEGLSDADRELLSILERPLDLEALLGEITLVARSRSELAVVLIDRDRIHAARVAGALTELGCTVDDCVNTRSALALLAQRKDPLILLDINCDGAGDITLWARAHNRPVIAFTPEGSRFTQEELMRLGAALVMTKPVDCNALLTQVRFLSLV
jgi:DNA-binding response OmpR family regulator